MNRSKSRLAYVFAILMLAIVGIAATLMCGSTAAEASADTEDVGSVEETEIFRAGEKVAEPYGIYTALSLSIDGSGGYVWATATNEITIFPSTVRVIVELYSSMTYQESYLDMEQEGREYVHDLDMGQRVTIKVPTNGVQRYWKARMLFKVDNDDWDTRVTSTWLLDGNGIIII